MSCLCYACVTLTFQRLCVLYIVLAIQGLKMLDVVSAKLFLNIVNVALISECCRIKGFLRKEKHSTSSIGEARTGYCRFKVSF